MIIISTKELHIVFFYVKINFVFAHREYTEITLLHIMHIGLLVKPIFCA